YLAVHLFDQRLLGRKIPVQQRLGDADLLGQLAGAAIESVFGKILHCLAYNHLLAFDRIHALGAATRFVLLLCGWHRNPSVRCCAAHAAGTTCRDGSARIVVLRRATSSISRFTASLSEPLFQTHRPGDTLWPAFPTPIQATPKPARW